MDRNQAMMKLGEYCRNTMIRPSKIEDCSRMAEIIVLAKRMFYRNILNNDTMLFEELQVYSLCQEFMAHPEVREQYYVFEDAFPKGIIRVENKEVVELYVDPFFQMTGIGAQLLDYAKDEFAITHTWIMEKNAIALRFFEKNGFCKTEEKRVDEATEVAMIKLVRK